jgi:hypothetical protein
MSQRGTATSNVEETARPKRPAQNPRGTVQASR